MRILEDEEQFARPLAGPIGNFKSIIPDTDELATGYLKMERAERAVAAHSFDRHYDWALPWYRLLNLYFEGLNHLRSVPPERRPPLDGAARDARFHLFLISGGTSKAAFDAALAGYYTQSLALTRHLLETFIQMCFTRKFPHEGVRWFDGPASPGEE